MPGIPLPHFLLLKLSFNMPLKLELHHYHYSESEWETIPLVVAEGRGGRKRGGGREGSDLAAAPGGGLARSPLRCAASPAFPPSSVKTDSVPRFRTGCAHLTAYEAMKGQM